MTQVPCSIAVEVATGWTSPEAPRPIDAAAVADVPDPKAWLAALDERGAEARLVLHGRTVTQFLLGEPVDVVEEAGDWVRVIGPWQPSELDPRGYPAWVPRAHIAPRDADAATSPAGQGVAVDRVAICAAAREHLGLPYLWGGTSPYGLDCSGLVHHSYRRAGVVVPRDAHDQYRAAASVEIGSEQPGDLYFFARDDGYVFHVGFVSGRGTMLHAPETGRGVEDGPLAPERVKTIFAVGRFLA